MRPGCRRADRRGSSLAACGRTIRRTVKVIVMLQYVVVTTRGHNVPQPGILCEFAAAP